MVKYRQLEGSYGEARTETKAKETRRQSRTAQDAHSANLICDPGRFNHHFVHHYGGDFDLVYSKLSLHKENEYLQRAGNLPALSG
jgi:hypothetical protein